MRRLWPLLLLPFVACECGPRQTLDSTVLHDGVLVYSDGLRSVARFHDAEKKVTCWIQGAGGIYCLRDADLR